MDERIVPSAGPTAGTHATTTLDELVLLRAENARLRQEQTALARLATAFDTTAGLQVVLQTAARLLAAVLNAERVAILLYSDASSDASDDACADRDWATVRAYATHNYPEGALTADDLALPIASIPVEQELLTTRRAVTVATLAGRRGRIAPVTHQAALAVPLLCDQHVTGCFYLDGGAAASLATLDSDGFLDAVASQIAVAIEQTQRYARAQRRRAEAAALVTVASALRVGQPLDTMLHAIVEQALAALKAERAGIALLDPVTGLVTVTADAVTGHTASYKLAVEHLHTMPVLAQALREGRPLAVDDVLAWSGPPLTAAHTYGSRSFLIAPIPGRTAPLGAFFLEHQQTRRHWSADDRQFAEALAGQASVALANAQSYAAEQQRAAREAILREVERELSAKLDLTQVLDTVQHQLKRLTGLDNCWLALWDEASNTGRFCRWLENGQRIEQWEDTILQPEGLIGELVREQAPIATDDYAAECARRGIDPFGHLANLPGRAWFGLPLLTGGRAIGAMAIWDWHGPLSSETIATLETLAGQIATAVENARLYQETERQHHQEAAFNAIARDLAASLDSDIVLSRIAEHAQALLAGAFAEILLYEPDGNVLRSATHHGASIAVIANRQLDPAKGLAGAVWTTGQPLAAADYLADQRFTHTPQTDEWARAAGLRSQIGTLIHLGDERLGVLLVGYCEQPRSFTPHDEALLARLATQAALAVRNARLYADARRRAAHLEILNEIGHELHAELDLDRFLTVAWRQLTRVIAVDNYWLARWHEQSNEANYCLYVADNERRPDYERSLTPGTGLAWALFTERATINVPDYPAECRRRGLQAIGVGSQRADSAWLGVPLLAGGQLVGAMAVWRYGQPFTNEEATTFETLGGQIAAAMETARLYQEARTLATTDPLTGLANHRHIHERLDEELARARRRHHSLAVVMLDLDNFKHFNDTYGHPAGDRMLTAVAHALRTEARTFDVLGRYGGDEFMLVLPETTLTGALALLERMRARLATVHNVIDDDCSVSLTISTGIAVYPDDATQRQELVALADAALYVNKRGSRPVAATGNEPAPALTLAKPGLDFLMVLVRAIDANDRLTLAHSETVAEVAVTIGKALGLPERTRQILHLAGLVHDVGKVAVLDHVLTKAGPLTSDDWSLLRYHVECGELLIRAMPRLNDLVEPVMHHHERWDGRGYPRGLAGDDVPLLGRILALAEAYGTIVHDTPYHRRLTTSEVVAELRAGAGSQFDPQLAELLAQAVEHGNFGRARSQ